MHRSTDTFFRTTRYLFYGINQKSRYGFCLVLSMNLTTHFKCQQWYEIFLFGQFYFVIGRIDFDENGRKFAGKLLTILPLLVKIGFLS